MIRKIKKGVRRLLGIKNDTDYYSQAGEDAVLSKTFSSLLPVTNGFYIDIGSYHPFRHSNTYLLYKSGWKGINIDPRPGSKKLFDRYRKRDINIEAGISNLNGVMSYYFLGEDSTMNTFSKSNLEKLNLLDKVQYTIEIPIYTIETLLRKVPHVKTIDYMNIDAEGLEVEILNGLNFEYISPTVISIEQNSVFSLKDVLNSEVNNLLCSKGYLSYAKNVIVKNIATVFYIKSDILKY